MSDLRALLYERYPRYVDDAVDFAGAAAEAQGEGPYNESLATRLPACVPAGLEWRVAEWRVAEWRRLTGWTFRDVVIDDEIAELLFMGQAVKVLACDPRPMPRDIEEFAVALHKLADEMGV